MAELNRHQERQVAFQTLFSLAMNPDADVKVVVQQVLNGDPEIEWQGALPEQVLTLVAGVTEQVDQLDVKISDHLAAGWTLDRLGLTDLVLLRLALYEAQLGQTPTNVVINEALQLAHTFTDDQSRKFINGVLNNILTAAE
ncbi:transcription antitermination factor NusB [Weissella halotolerans]|uniref:Transcription antitermination protein NusB n=1 Tax=Weissella halotolerans DSM 20190 TaxID=1123500 RepID=A0A0R2G062_9LACO|nr:transcription antitermination factor NusB [Weissella halotolerans]KRN30826.1 transcription antitermination protein NusB [Weissella halotolerans DSM 20190]